MQSVSSQLDIWLAYFELLSDSLIIKLFHFQIGKPKTNKSKMKTLEDQYNIDYILTHIISEREKKSKIDSPCARDQYVPIPK